MPSPLRRVISYLAPLALSVFLIFSARAQSVGDPPISDTGSSTLIPFEANLRMAFDTAAVFVPRAANFNRCRIPRAWGFAAGGDSTSRYDWVHVGGIYLPGGFHGYNRWMAATPFDSTQHEVPCLRVSNDGEDWTVFYNGRDTCRDPLFTRDSCRHNGAPSTYLSDTDILMGRDGRIWIIWRATREAIDTTYQSLWVTSTADGIHWSPGTKILGWWADPKEGPRLSPAWWVDQSGNYRMWVVQSHASIPDSNVIELWQAPRPDSGWMLLDTVRRVGSNDLWMGTGDISQGGAWHVEVIDFDGGKKIVLMVNRYSASNNYRRLYIGLTPDDGRSLDMRYAPLLLPSDTLASAGAATPWDSRSLYRSTAYWVTNGSDSALEMVYVGNTPAEAGTAGVAGHWRMGVTRIDNADKVELMVDTVSLHPGDFATVPIRIINPQDTIAGFSVKVRTGKTSMIRFLPEIDTAGTLLSGWEVVRESTLTSDGSVLRIVGRSSTTASPLAPIIRPSDLPRTLIRLRIEALKIPDTLTDRTVSIVIDRNVRWTGFTYNSASPIGSRYSYITDTFCLQCQQRDDTTCLSWQQVTSGPCDSLAIIQDSLLDYDTTITFFKDGTVTLAPCSDIALPADIDGDGVAFTPADRADLQAYVTTGQSALIDFRNADINGDCRIGWADLYAFDRYVKFGPDSLRLPICTCPQPAWDCCWGRRGNVNNDAQHVIDLSDLSMLIAYLIGNRQVVCQPEANINGTGVIDLTDLSQLIAFLTLPIRPLPAACP